MKFVDIDFFAPSDVAVAELPFQPAERYIPSQRSLFKGLATNLDVVSQKLPELADRGAAALAKLERILDDVHDARIPARFADTLDRAAAAVADVRRIVRGIDRAKLPEQAARSLADFDAAVARIDRAVAQVEGNTGLIASVRRAADSFGDFGRAASDDTVDLARTLQELGDAARAVRELAEAIERDPSMLVAGRARSKGP